MIYTEKYRPKTFDEVIGVKDINKLKELISSPETLPNLLFVGQQGIGKTTCAKIILKELSPIDVLKLNGSDTTGVDTIREQVYSFISSMSSVYGKPKIVWIEEFDYMSASAYAALRSMIESFSKNARFICTANYISKIPEPIQSRFSIFEFVKPTDEEITNRLRLISINEKITVEDRLLTEIAKMSKGDVRSAVNSLQLLSSNPEKKISPFGLINIRNLTQDVYNKLLEGEWTKLRYELPKLNPDYNKLIVELDDMFFNSELPTGKKADINEVLSAGQMEMSLSFNKDIAFGAICSRLIKVLKE